MLPPSSFTPPSRAGSSRSPVDQHQAIYDEFEAYPFSDDPDFKAGLPTVISAIRGQKRTAAQIDEMIGRAQWFYFNRLKAIQIPWETYVAYSRSQSTTANPSPSPSASSASRSSTPARQQRDPLATLNNLAEARRMMNSDNRSPPGREVEGGMSFSMLCALISEGRAGEVPGVVQIPDELNAAPASQPVMPQRLKPWEMRRISPPGTSASFTDPPMAPSPSFDMTFNLDSTYVNLPQDPSSSTGHSPVSAFSHGSISPNMQQSYEYSDPLHNATSSHRSSPSQSLANLSFSGDVDMGYGQQLGVEALQNQGQSPAYAQQEGYEPFDPTSNIWQGGTGGGSGNGYHGY